MNPIREEFNLGTTVHGQPLRLVREHTPAGATWTLIQDAANQRDESRPIRGMTDDTLRAIAAVVNAETKPLIDPAAMRLATMSEDQHRQVIQGNCPSCLVNHGRQFSMRILATVPGIAWQQCGCCMKVYVSEPLAITNGDAT